MSTQKRARRAARQDKRYCGAKHDAATHTRRLAAKVSREGRMAARKNRQKAKI
jgi:hypothetical protein